MPLDPLSLNGAKNFPPQILWRSGCFLYTLEDGHDDVAARRHVPLFPLPGRAS